MEKQMTSKTKEIELKPYLKYQDRFLLKNKYNFIISVITVLIILFMLFLPVLKSSYTMKLSDIKDINMYEKIIKDLTPQEILEGKFNQEENFSIVDELVKNIKGISSSKNNVEQFVTFAIMLFPLFTVIMGIVLLISTGKQIYGYATYNSNLEKSVMLDYDLVKKRNETKEKNFFKKQTLMSFLLDFLFSIIYGIFVPLVLEIASDRFSYFFGFKGISLFVILPIGLFVAYLVFTIKNKKLTKELENDIVSEEYNEKAL